MKPFLQGRKSLPIASLHLPERAVRSVAKAGETAGDGRKENTGPAGPVVETVKEGDKIVRLVVTCACGERVEIECLYPVGS